MDSKFYNDKGNNILQRLFKGFKNILTSKYSVNDAYVETDNKIILSEIKTRNFNSTKYPSDLLEDKKLTNLLKKAEKQKKDTDVFYFNYFTDNVLIRYDLKEIKKLIDNKDKRITETYLNCNKATASDIKGSGDKIPKKVFLLSKFLGKIINLD